MTDKEVEDLLHEVAQRLADARHARKAQTPEGDSALRVALVGPYAALMRMEKKAPPIED